MTPTLPPGLLIAAPRSGGGKTTLTLGLLRALKHKGVTVQPFKCGPDYIDPGFHTKAAGRTSVNIDTWAMRETLAHQLVETHAQGADIVVAEALMGLFDGVDQMGAWANGSSATLAKATGWPVILILDVSGQSQTAAAIAKGFATFDPDVKIGGIILNRVGSDRHRRLVANAIEGTGVKLLGALPRTSDIELPERHLGLVLAEETPQLDGLLDRLATFVASNVDIDALCKTAHSASWHPATNATANTGNITPPGQRIALARDEAFSFVYPHVLSSWRGAGSEIIPFSPLADEAPDDTCDVIWLPGGYPELHAGRLANAKIFLNALRAAADLKPIHGECGGFMVLGKALESADGKRHELAGLLDLETSFKKRKMHLGYRLATLLKDCSIGRAGDAIRGHEFHYASITSGRDEPLADLVDATGNPVAEKGARRGNVTGSFFHLIDKT